MKKLLAIVIAIALIPFGIVEAQSHLLVVTGIGGEPRYSDQFLAIGKSFVQSVRARHGVAQGAVVFLAEDPARDSMISGKATKENVQKEIERIASSAKPGDYVVIALIGHGSSQGAEGYFNIPGPDLGMTDYNKLLEPLSAQRVAFLSLFSGSGDFVGVLSGPGRIIVTATKTGFERNEVFFPKYFVEAFEKDGADVDKDGRVSLFEAFDYGNKETKRFYEDDVRLQTEHAMLDDNGDRKGSHEPDPRAADGDGATSRTFFLAGKVSAAAAQNPVLSKLLQEKADIEAAIETLRKAKPTMDVTVYETQLEKLILDLAAKNKAIKDAGGEEEERHPRERTSPPQTLSGGGDPEKTTLGSRFRGNDRL